jgi:hypothetical protein
MIAKLTRKCLTKAWYVSSYLFQLFSVNVLSHRPLEILWNDAQLAVQNVKNVVMDQQVEDGPQHGVQCSALTLVLSATP